MFNDISAKLLSFNQDSFDELYIIDTIVKMTQKSCQDLEFSGEYYGMPQDMVARLSEERNHYINMLNLLSEHVSNIMNINLLMEKEMTLQKDTYNCGRKIAAQCSAD